MGVMTRFVLPTRRVWLFDGTIIIFTAAAVSAVESAVSGLFWEDIVLMLVKDFIAKWFKWLKQKVPILVIKHHRKTKVDH